jgi:hypothetical protein
MKTNPLTNFAFMFIAATIALGGCADVESTSDDVAKVEMTPWRGTPRLEIAQVLSEHPGGVQINEDQIAWNDGKVVLTIPSSTDVSADAISDCPPGWFCLWQDAQFMSRKVQFQGAGCQSLDNFGFNNLASSWFNRNGGTYRVYLTIGCKDGVLFTAESGARSSFVGNANNDKASAVCRGSSCP